MRRRNLHPIERSRTEFIHPTLIAVVYTALGDHDHAFQKLEEAIRVRESGVSNVLVEPGLDPLKADPRFAAIQQKIRSAVRD